MDGLRSQTNVPHDGDLRIQHALDEFHALRSTLQLHRLGARLFHKAHGVADAFRGLSVVGAKGHVGNHQC